MTTTKPVLMAEVPSNVSDGDALHSMGVRPIGSRLDNLDDTVTLHVPNGWEWVDGVRLGCSLAMVDDRGITRITVYMHGNPYHHEPETVVVDVGLDIAHKLAGVETADLESVGWYLLSDEEKASAQAEFRRLLASYEENRIVYFDQIYTIEHWLNLIAHIEGNE